MYDFKYDAMFCNELLVLVNAMYLFEGGDTYADICVKRGM